MSDVCPMEVHEAMKADDSAWTSLEHIGTLPGFLDLPALEHRNCKCGSTLVRRATEKKAAA